MMFETNLKLSDSTRTDIMSQISALAPGDAILSPALFESGTVQCVALNVQGPGGTVAGPAAQGSFQAVESILGASLPSMTGDEDAIFSLTLSQDGADIMNAAFDAGAQPTGVIYNLTFLGIRPALEVRITADYKRIFDELSASLTATVYFVQAGIDATLEKLKEDGAIKMEVLAFTDDADLAAKEDWAMNFFRDKLLTEWFQPSLQPIPSLASGTAVAGATNPTPFPGTPSTPPVRPPLPPAPPVGQLPPRPAGSVPPAPPGVVGTPQTVGAPGTVPGVVGAPQTVGAPGAVPGVATPAGAVGAAAGAVAGAVAGGLGGGAAGAASGAALGAAAGAVAGSSPPGGTKPSGTPNLPAPVASAAVSFKLRLVEEQELKTVTFDYSEQEATKRTYAPQGFFGILGAELDSSHFVDVDLNDPFFQTLAVDVLPPPEPADIGLLDATVGIDYGDQSDPAHYKHADLLFDQASTGRQQFQAFVNPSYDLSYSYALDFHFDPGSGWQAKDLAYHFPAQRTEDRTLRVDPRYNLGFLDVRVVAGRIDKALVTRTDVSLHYEGDDGWAQDSVISVVAGQADQRWRLRVADMPVAPFAYSVVHHLVDGTSKTTSPVTTTVPVVVVDDPFPQSLDLDFIPLFDPAKTREVLIDVTYDDTKNNYHRNERLTLAGSARSDALLRIALMDPTNRAFQYRLTFVGTDNSLDEGAFVTSTDTLIGVHP